MSDPIRLAFGRVSFFAMFDIKTEPMNMEMKDIMPVIMVVIPFSIIMLGLSAFAGITLYKACKALLDC